MARTEIPHRDKAPAASHATLDAVGKALGFVPNLHRLLAKSPNALAGWLGLMSNLAKTLDAKTRDGIALAVSGVSDCDYCLHAHAYVASTFSKLSREEIALNRQAHSSDPKKDAAVQFAKKVIEQRGKVSDEDFAAVKAAGFSDEQVLEIVSLSAQFLMTNFVNNVFQTDVDFPLMDRPEEATAKS